MRNTRTHKAATRTLTSIRKLPSDIVAGVDRMGLGVRPDRREHGGGYYRQVRGLIGNLHLELVLRLRLSPPQNKIGGGGWVEICAPQRIE